MDNSNIAFCIRESVKGARRSNGEYVKAKRAGWDSAYQLAFRSHRYVCMEQARHYQRLLDAQLGGDGNMDRWLLNRVGAFSRECMA